MPDNMTAARQQLRATLRALEVPAPAVEAILAWSSTWGVKIVSDLNKCLEKTFKVKE